MSDNQHKPSTPFSAKVRMLWGLTQGQRLKFAVAIFMMFLAALAMFVPPLISKVAIDHVVQNKPLDAPQFVQDIVAAIGGRGTLAANLWICGLGILAFSILSGAFTYVKDRLTSLASEGVTRRLRNRLYDRLQRLPCSFHDKAETGDLVQRCTSDVETVKGFLGSQTVEITRLTLMLITVLPFMIAISGRMTILAMTMMPVVVVFSLVFFAKVRKAFRFSDEAEGAMTTVLQENLTGIRVVRAFARQDFECEKFGQKNASFRDATFRLLRLLAWYWSSSDFTCHIQNVILMVCGSYWVMTGAISVGTLFAFTVYENMLLWPMRGMGRVLTDLGKATVSMERLQAILEHPLEQPTSSDGAAVEAVQRDTSDAKSTSDEFRGEIVARDLSFGFDGQRAVLDGVSFEVKPGQTFAILGASGSGKSVLIHLLLRFYDYGGGSLRIDGRELRELDRGVLRSNVGVVLQEPFIYSKSLRQNITLGRSHAADGDVVEAATAACIHDSIMGFDKGYDTLVGERGVTLSGGQRQRVALARAMLKDPAILILDDAMSAVDTRTESMILSALRMRHGRRTTLLISHRLSALRQADQIMVLDQGKVAQRGTHEQLLAIDGLYANLWRIQSSLEDDLGAELRNNGQAKTELVNDTKR